MPNLTIHIEQGPTSWGAHVEGIDGACVVADTTLDGLLRRLARVLPLHLEAEAADRAAKGES